VVHCVAGPARAACERVGFGFADAERAVERHESIADKGSGACRLAGLVCFCCFAHHGSCNKPRAMRWKRDPGSFCCFLGDCCNDGSVGQIRDAFAADLAEAREGFCVRHGAEGEVDELSEAFERRSVMRRSKQDARSFFQTLKERWTKDAGDAVVCLEKDIDVLLTHYDFPREHWDALRTTNPIERVNKEFKRRSKAMEVIGPDGLKALLAFTALRLEFGWSRTPITAPCLKHLKKGSERQLQPIDTVIKSLLN
jgi:Transposase, Mutator family